MHVLDEITRLIILVKGILCSHSLSMIFDGCIGVHPASSSTKRFGCFLLLGVNRVSLTIN